MTIQAKVTFTATTGLPEDQVVNTFHFGPVGGPNPASATIAGELIDFYNGLHGAQVQRIGAWMSNFLSRNADTASIDLYDMSDPSPRQPIYTDTFTLTAAASSNGLPTEVALCVSWKADVASGEDARRRRGRNYIGPLDSSASVTTLGIPRPSTQLISDLALAGLGLMTGSSDLRIYSTAVPGSPAAYPVTSGWVDNAFDTQRRRGVDPSSRSTFA